MARMNPKARSQARTGGAYDPEVVELTRKSREPKPDWHPPTQEEQHQAESKWKRTTRGSDTGAMIRTNTYNPRLAVAREKITELRRAKRKREA